MNRRKFVIGSAISLAAAGIGSLYWPRRWKYIVIHHSAGSYGNISHLKKVHRQRQAGGPIDAIPYHFIIGNGNGMAMGEIAGGWRREHDVWGAHVSVNNRDRNFRGIGICLIGNYETNKVPERQYEALVSLTKSLMREHNIVPENVNGHGYIKGESTKCPGKHFPMEAFLKEIT